MKGSLPAALVKRSLTSHSWLGLALGALMYLVCLSGTLAVFYPELHRWEQPRADEYPRIDAAAVERSYHQLTAGDLEVTHHMYVALPAPDMPRASISNDHGGWYLNHDGSTGERVQHAWTDMVVNLHLYLHLPMSFGMIVVSALGALLCGLIVSGLLAHPRLFKDAFVLRLGGARALEQADIHNRLSVWSSPFQLIIAITGAYFGLAQLMALAMAPVFYGGSTEQLMASVFGEEPRLQQPLQPLALEAAISQVRALAPQATPLYVTVEDAGTPEQYMIVGALHPQRLIYVEQYRFDTAGNYLDSAGFLDGPAGRQIAFSIYRLHFGHFGGQAVKLLYGLLGLAMVVVCATGMNIWLAKRKRRDALNVLWPALVWGSIPALALAAITQIFLDVAATATLWLGIATAAAFAHTWQDHAVICRRLQWTGALLLTALVASHVVVFTSSALQSAAGGVNAALLAIAVVLAAMAHGRRRSAPTPGETTQPDNRPIT